MHIVFMLYTYIHYILSSTVFTNVLPHLSYFQQPFFSYSAQDPMKFFAVSIKDNDWGYSDQSTTASLRIPRSGTVQWVGSANAISRPQLLDVLNSSIGTEQLIYLYAKARGTCVILYM